jgi:hypothetical protein
MRFVGVFVLLAGCAGSDGWPYQREEPQRWSSKDAEKSPTPWHRDKRSGLAIRAVELGPYELGGAVRVRVEAQNQGDRPVVFDHQGLVHDPYLLTAPGGKPAPWVGPLRGQSWQHFTVLEPGQSQELSTIDLTHLYAFLGSGDYSFQFTGLCGWGFGPEPPEGVGPPGSILTSVPESAPLRLHIGEGTITKRDQVVARIHPVMPKQWNIHDGPTSDPVHLVIRRREIRPNVSATLELVVLQKPGAVESCRRLGASPLGEVWLGKFTSGRFDARNAEDDRVQEELRPQVVPMFERIFAEALEVRP